MKYILLLIPFLGLIAAAALLNLLGIRFFVITSGSMEPQLSKGDIIVTQHIDNYKVGNVISYKNNGRVVTHKIIAKHLQDGRKAYQTKGNANEVADSGLVVPKNIIGKVFHAFPKVGLLFLLPKKFYITSLMWLMSGLIIYLELRQLYQSVRKYAA